MTLQLNSLQEVVEYVISMRGIIDTYKYYIVILENNSCEDDTKLKDYEAKVAKYEARVNSIMTELNKINFKLRIDE